MWRYQPRTILLSLLVLLWTWSNGMLAEDKTVPAEPPPVMDLLKYQTPIRNQGERDTCPYFPPVAALEAAYARKGVKVDLSVEHLLWLRNVASPGGGKEKRDVAENLSWTVGGGNGMGILKQFAICRSQDMPYHAKIPADAMKQFGLSDYDWSKPASQFLLNRWNFDPRILPPKARENAKYAIDKFTTMPAKDLRDPRKFEEILASGHEIVFAVNIHENSDDSAMGEPVWRLKPGTKPSTVNHFMLMVGYDRPRKFFIVKNQWGPTKYNKAKLAKEWTDVVRYDGYLLLDYNYLEACAEAHYITDVVPVDSTRFVAQRALGLWQVAFKNKNKSVMSGVLVWRHLSNPELNPPDLRIGDLVTKDGQQFRVNAKLEGDGKKPYQVTLYINFSTGEIPPDSTDGIAWKGTLTLSQKDNATLELSPAGESDELLWDSKAADLQITAIQVGKDNPLLKMTAPK
jgi:Papain family cysteine protease